MSSRMNYGKRFRGSAISSGNGAELGINNNIDRQNPALWKRYQAFLAGGKKIGMPTISFFDFLKRAHFFTFPRLSDEGRLRGQLRAASSKSKKAVHLAGDPPPVIPPACPPSLPARIIGTLLHYEQDHKDDHAYETLAMQGHNDFLLSLGYISENPRDPESGTFAITKRGLDHCDYLRSAKK